MSLPFSHDPSLPVPFHSAGSESRLSAGPWSSEINIGAWLDDRTKLNCAMVRNHFGAWCGYVGVAKGHPLYGCAYGQSIQLPMVYIEQLRQREFALGRDFGMMALLTSDISVEREDFVTLPLVLPAHGSLSFSGPGDIDSGLWWLGFDCAHAGDLIPALERFSRLHDIFGTKAVYRTQEYVYGVVTRLAWAIQEAAVAIDSDFSCSPDNETLRSG